MDTDNIKDSKKCIRKQILEKRNQLSEDIIKNGGRFLRKKMSSNPLFLSSLNILAYASYGSEVSTYDFIELCFECGKRVFLPKVIGKDMIFYEIESLGDLICGYKNIPEPSGKSRAYDYFSDYNKNTDTMLLMPGVVFDNSGHRIGYGGGFYDRYLSDKTGLLDRSVSVCYDFQRLESIPFENHDIICREICIIDSSLILNI